MSAVTPASVDVVTLRHGKVELALHRLRAADGPALLLLHGLGERSPAVVPDQASGWPGSVWALDFTGHGGSTLARGGGYTAEVLMADADTALGHLGTATLLGRGLGAYVALLLAGARADRVRGAVLTDGVGLTGGGVRPAGPSMVRIAGRADRTPDPYALAELSRDVRPPEYALAYVRLAVQFSSLSEPLAVSAVVRPEWLDAVCDEPGVVETSVEAALERFATAATAER